MLIFDEPTAALTDRESGRLFAFIRSFRARGGAIFYISHRLDEVFALADRISVLRDGVHRGRARSRARHQGRDGAPHGWPGERRAVRGDLFGGSGRSRTAGERALPAGEFHEVSFELRRGEILGVAGLVGSGRTELGKCLFGLTRADEGTIEVLGERRRFSHPADAIAAGLVYLPEERKQEGIFPLLSIAENMALSSFGRFQGVLGLRLSAIERGGGGFRQPAPHQARPPLRSDHQPQRRQPAEGDPRALADERERILILDEPTRGIDVNAKREIQRQLRHLVGEGLAIVYISSELQEVLDVSDRILVMHEGRVKGIVQPREATQESLLALAMS